MNKILNIPKSHPLIAYKAFNDDLTCNGFQYEIGKIYEIPKKDVSLCNFGFHACENPFGVFSYYSISHSRFCIVEQWGKIETEESEKEILTYGGSKKQCSSGIRVVKELTLNQLIEEYRNYFYKNYKNNDSFCFNSNSNFNLFDYDDKSDIFLKGIFHNIILGKTYNANMLRILLDVANCNISVSNIGWSLLVNTGNSNDLSILGHNMQFINTGYKNQINLRSNLVSTLNIGHFCSFSLFAQGSKFVSYGNKNIINITESASSKDLNHIICLGEDNTVIVVGRNNFVIGNNGTRIIFIDSVCKNSPSKTIIVGESEEFPEGKLYSYDGSKICKRIYDNDADSDIFLKIKKLSEINKID